MPAIFTVRSLDATYHVSVTVLGLVFLALACSHAAMAKDVVPLQSTAHSDDLDLNENQRLIIEAVKAQNYDVVAKLTAKAKQLAEFEQVAKETLNDGPMAGWSRTHAVRLDAFFSSLIMILVSELGDKTFFIAAIMAMKHSRGVVLVGALGALALMTLLSAAAGFALPNLIPRTYTHYASVVLFFVFGVKLLKDAREMSDGGGPSEELEEVEAELNMADKKKNPDIECEPVGDDAKGLLKISPFNSVLWQAFTLTFLAEWGDRSQIATIALAAQKDPIGVTAGGIIGHAICTGLAVTGGRMLASRISEKTVSYSGGFLFLLFALHGIWQGGSALNNA